MTTFIDTSVLIPLLSAQAEHHQWCRDRLDQADPPVVVSDIVYVELSVGMISKEETDAAISDLALERRGYSDEVLYRAGRAFLQYKENDGPRDSLLPDFLVGALAEIEGEPLLTRDPGKVRTYFPGVQLIHPDAD